MGQQVYLKKKKKKKMDHQKELKKKKEKNLVIINIFQFDHSLVFWGLGKHKVPMSIGFPLVQVSTPLSKIIKITIKQN